MQVYRHAVRHAWMMLLAVVVAFLLIAVVDQYYGHSALAFAAAIALLIGANARILQFTCPKCGKNLFFRGLFVVPWPNKVCGKCKTDLSSEPHP